MDYNSQWALFLHIVKRALKRVMKTESTVNAGSHPQKCYFEVKWELQICGKSAINLSQLNANIANAAHTKAQKRHGRGKSSFAYIFWYASARVQQ